MSVCLLSDALQEPPSWISLAAVRCTVRPLPAPRAGDLLCLNRWSAIQTLLERSVSDVLILLDCCAGAASATFATGQSITETISASSWDAIAPDPGRYSFTNALIEVLEEWRLRTFSAAMLHAEILARLKHPRPILINGKHFEARSTPVHFMMTSNHKAPSIEICRLVHTSRLPPSPPSELAYWHRPPEPRMIEGRNHVEQVHYPLPIDRHVPYTSDPNEDEPHVLISLALEDDQRLDLDAWETWLAEVPALAKYVKVQGVFKSHSTLLLLSLPVTIWDFLPDDPACSFVAFIRSNNLLRARQSDAAPPDARTSVAAGAPTSHQDQTVDDAESCLSGTTYGQTESMHIVRRGTTVSNTNQTPSAASVPVRTGTSVSTAPECSPQDAFASPGQSQRPVAHPSSSLRNVASHASLATQDGQHPPSRTLSTSTAPVEGITRAMIMNKSRTSKKSVFLSDQVPEGQPMAPHVVRRLEDYFQKDPEPSIAVVEHLASNLGVETADIHVGSRGRATARGSC